MSLCCNAHQIDVIVAVCAYTVLILGTWRVDAVVKPFKLLAVFVHEGCHACACLATGGRVDGVEVNIIFFLGVCVFLAWASLAGIHHVRVVAQFVLLFVTTYVSVFSVYDIYDDCVRRYVNDSQTKSDAVVCAQLCPVCPARGWGVVWLVISLGLWAGGVCYLVLHVGGHLDL